MLRSYFKARGHLRPFCSLSPKLQDSLIADPDHQALVDRLCPVPFFGNLESATTLSVALNPSDREFFDPAHGKSRVVFQRHDPDGYYDACLDYFNPSRGTWYRTFGTLEHLASKFGIGSTSKDLEGGRAAHVDLLPWVTSLKWGAYMKTLESNLELYPELEALFFTPQDFRKLLELRPEIETIVFTSMTEYYVRNLATGVFPETRNPNFLAITPKGFEMPFFDGMLEGRRVLAFGIPLPNLNMLKHTRIVPRS